MAGGPELQTKGIFSNLYLRMPNTVLLHFEPKR